ncbi:MAG TPA: PH domain-containing protein [Brachybacterium sp.]|nr:PH domain-containing protein [Brachybacterium sp.]
MSTSGADADGGQQRETIVLRPRAVRVAAYFSAVVVMAGMIGGAVLITSFQWGGRLGLILVGVLVFLFCHLEASVKVTARPDELEVRNLMRTRTLAWPEVLGVSFPMGDPWAHLDLADGRTHPLQAIQRYDGDRAIAAAHQLQRLIRERGEASPL